VPVGQTWPQVPQLLFEFRFVSHPSATFPLQLPQPAKQETPHWELRQVGELFWWGGQTLLQAPQLLTFAAVFVSQPSSGLLLQSP
jgi:hypothetical protein